MRPETLRIRNFGPFAGEAVIRFDALDDIFLITGKTGSGKTSIFDALCYALYGAVPGSRKDHLSRLRSDYAAEGAECFVSLEFSLEERRYRIDRSPRHEERKKRGGGLRVIEESAALYELGSGFPVCLNTKKSEADEKVRSLIGLDKDEFFKIVLLPQGEFAEFLRQKTSDKRNVLGKLFPVDGALAIRELAQDRFRTAQIEAQEAERSLAELGKRVSGGAVAELWERAEAALALAREQTAALAVRAETLRGLLSLRKNEAEAGRRLAEAEGEAARLEEEGRSIPEKQSRLALSRKAHPLLPFLERFEERQREAALAAGAVERAGERLAAAASLAERAEAESAAIPGLEEQARKLREKRPGLRDLIREEAELGRLQTGTASLEAARELLAAEAASLAGQGAAMDAEIQRLEAVSARADSLNARWEAARTLKDALLELKKAVAEGEALAEESRQNTAALAGLTTRSGELCRRIPVLEAEYRSMAAEKEAQERQGMAAGLAAALEAGEPCPVCGSRDHPLPAAALVPRFGIRERLEAQDRSIKDAGRDLAQAKAEKEAREREQGRLGARLEELWLRTEEIRAATLSPQSAEPQLQPDLPECFKPDGPIPAFSMVNALLAVQVTSLNALTTERDEARRAGSRLSGLYQANQALQSAAANNERERALTAEKLKTLSAALSERRQKGEQFLVSLEPLLAEARSPVKGLKPGTLLEEMDRMLAGTEAGIKTRREAREAATQELAAANALREEARRIREASIASLAEAAASLTSALASSPFAAALDAIDSAAIGAVVGSAVGSAEALRAAALDAGAETTLEAAIAGWQAARERLASQRAEIQRGLEAIRGELRVALAGAITPGQDGLEAELAALAGEQTVAEAAREQAGGELAALKRDEELYRDAEARFRELSQKAGRLGSLAEDLAGRNPHKKAFDAWLLGRYLTEVAAYATARLERMSESRYSLFLDNAPGGRVEGGRGLTGLDLAVFDAYTGKCRPCATLSGGESFMASISLALGLSDSIQNRSGGVRLDAVFIDEGFGSLDEASLDRALIILDELRDTRMVGLISHVGEMRSRIPSRIEVIKSPEGSRILQ